MNRKMILVSFLFFVGSFSAFGEQDSTTLWDGADGIVMQTFRNGDTLQSEYVHTFVRGNGFDSDWEFENYYKPEVDAIYSSFLNRYLKSAFFYEGNPDSLSWFKYQDGKVGVPLRRPFNRVRIIITINKDEVERGYFSNVNIWYNFVGLDGIEVRRPYQELRGFRTDQFNIIAGAMNRSFKEVGAYIPSDGTGFPKYSMDRIIQKPLSKVVSQDQAAGVMPDTRTTSPIKR